MKLLIAYDGSAGAQVALENLARAGLPSQTEARVLSIADVWLPAPPPPDEGVFPPSERIAAAYEHALAALESAKEAASEGSSRVQQLFPGWKVTHTARAESPAWGILAEARSWKADLVVIGSHGRTPLERFFLGSVSFKVAAEAACSVRVVRSHSAERPGPLRLMLGMDGSTDALKAAEEIMERAWPAGTEVDVLTVVDPKLRTEELRHGGASEATSRLEYDSYLQGLLEQTCERLMRRGLIARWHRVVDGDAKRTLLQHAAEWRSDCIFLGARGLEHGDRLYLGTVASAVCSRARSSVEIVRRRATHAEAQLVGAK